MCSTTTDQRNWFRLQHLAGHSCRCLRQLFKKRYQQFFGQAWIDSPALGSQFYNSVIRSNHQNFKFLYPSQRVSIQNGNSEDWDITLLAALLLNISRPQTLSSALQQALDTEDKYLKDLRDIRNDLAHHATRLITDIEFSITCKKLKSILIFFGEDDTELDKLVDDIELKSSKEIFDDTSVKEMNALNALGKQSFKDKNFKDAIKHFTNATVLPHLPADKRALLYSNLSSSRLALYEQVQQTGSTYKELATSDDERYHALRDAKQARNLWPTWWKAHLRVGNAYYSINEFEKAVNSFERAFALDPLNPEVKQALDDSRSKYSEQQRHEHLDPHVKPQTMDDLLYHMDKNFEIDRDQVRSGQFLVEMIGDSALANVTKGHQYLMGDIEMGIKQDYGKAVKYFTEAVRHGSAEGMYNLAIMYDRGLGVETNHRYATHFFEQAAVQPPKITNTNLTNIGVAQAQHALGLRYYNGIDVPKNHATAVYWYKLAMDNDYELAANNLGIMYKDGGGITQDYVKAEQCFQFAAKKGEPNAMYTMSQLSLKKNDFLMAREWHQRACDAGHVLALTNKESFLEGINKRAALVNKLGPNSLNRLNQLTKIMDLASIKPMPSMSDSRIFDYVELQEHVTKGSLTAKRLCTALEHFYTALNSILHVEHFDENLFIHELAEAYRTEQPVVQVPGGALYKRFQEIIDRTLKNRPDDEDAQMCYVYFHTDQLEMNAKLLDQWKIKNPKYIHYYDISANINNLLKRFDLAVLDCNIGLKLDPNYYEFFYTKAFALGNLNHTDQNEIISIYQNFLNLAPKDHRKLPNAYYFMAQCYFIREKRTNHDTTSKIISDSLVQAYKQGLSAELLQLPYYLPYKSNAKKALEVLLDSVYRNENGIQSEQTQTTSIRQNTDHLMNPGRIQLFKEHRLFLADTQKLISNNSSVRITSTNPPRTLQKKPRRLANLKEITLREMNPTKNQIYENCVLYVTIIEQTLSFDPSIFLLIEDENLDIERLFIYGFSEEDGPHLIEEVFVMGNKMEILNPSLKIGTLDLRPSVRVDDLRSIIMQDDTDRAIKMCRCCGTPNAPDVCGKCKHARYCGRNCQVIDWKTYDHKLICKTAP